MPTGTPCGILLGVNENIRAELRELRSERDRLAAAVSDLDTRQTDAIVRASRYGLLRTEIAADLGFGSVNVVQRTLIDAGESGEVARQAVRDARRNRKGRRRVMLPPATARPSDEINNPDL